jgi:hypothetical protein
MLCILYRLLVFVNWDAMCNELKEEHKLGYA